MPRRFNLQQPSGPVSGEGGAYRMWDAIKAAIQSNATTLRFIAIIIVLALVAWFTRTLV